MKYDIAIVGAGIAGCALGFIAKSRGKRVLLIDRAATPATGGSSAAGAFISPKLGKKTSLLELTNLAYTFATKFYAREFREYFEQSGIVRLPKNAEDAKEFEKYQSYIGGQLIKPSQAKRLGVKSEFECLYFEDGGVCDAQGLCRALAQNIDFMQADIKDFRELFKLANKVVLANGYEGFSELEYMGISGIWGSRGDFYSQDDIKVCMHKSVSVSANKNGIIKIGATHVRAKNPTAACTMCDGEPLKELITEAKKIANLNEIKIKEIFCGMRSGSRDYFPLVGGVLDTKFLLENYPQIKNGFKKFEYKYIENLYVVNGFGGRGFVFAPLMATWLYEHIFEAQELDSKVKPERLFLKWARKLP